MHENKSPLKIISIVLFTVAAVFLVMTIITSIVYTPVPQSLNKKIVNTGKTTEDNSADDEGSVDEMETDFDSFTVTKDGASVTATDSGSVDSQ